MVANERLAAQSQQTFMILTKQQSLLLGFVILLGIATTIVVPPRVSLYVLGLLPAGIVSALHLARRGVRKPGITSVCFGIAAAFFFFSVVLVMYWLSSARIAGHLRNVRQSVLTRPEIQIGQPLPILSAEQKLEVLNVEEIRLQAASSLGLVTNSEPYSEAGILSILARDFSKAGQFLNSALTFKTPVGGVTNDLGVAFYYGGQKTQAAEAFEEAVESDRQGTASLPPITEAILFNNLGVVLRDKGELKEALEKFRESLEKSKGNAEIASTTRLQMAAVYRLQGNYKEAVEIADEILTSPGLSDYLIAFAFKVKGLIAEDEHEFTKALSYYNEAVTRYEKGGYAQDLAIVFNNMGNVYINDSEHVDRAKAIFYQRKAKDINRQLGLDAEEALNRANIAYVYYNDGDLESAMKEAEGALAIYRLKGAALGEQAAVLDTMGLIYQKQGNEQRARQEFEESLQLARRSGERYGQAEVLGHLAVLLANQKDYKTAKALVLEAEAIYEQIGDNKSTAEAQREHDEWETLAKRRMINKIN